MSQAAEFSTYCFGCGAAGARRYCMFKLHKKRPAECGYFCQDCIDRRLDAEPLLGGGSRFRRLGLFRAVFPVLFGLLVGSLVYWGLVFWG